MQTTQTVPQDYFNAVVSALTAQRNRALDELANAQVQLMLISKVRQNEAPASQEPDSPVA